MGTLLMFLGTCVFFLGLSKLYQGPSNNLPCDEMAVLKVKEYLESETVIEAIYHTYSIHRLNPRVFWENVIRMETICSSEEATYFQVYCKHEQTVTNGIERLRAKQPNLYSNVEKHLNKLRSELRSYKLWHDGFERIQFCDWIDTSETFNLSLARNAKVYEDLVQKYFRTMPDKDIPPRFNFTLNIPDEYEEFINPEEARVSCDKSVILKVKEYLESDAVLEAIYHTYSKHEINPRIFWENLIRMKNICTAQEASYLQVYCKYRKLISNVMQRHRARRPDLYPNLDDRIYYFRTELESYKLRYNGFERVMFCDWVDTSGNVNESLVQNVQKFDDFVLKYLRTMPDKTIPPRFNLTLKIPKEYEDLIKPKEKMDANPPPSQKRSESEANPAKGQNDGQHGYRISNLLEEIRLLKSKIDSMQKTIETKVDIPCRDDAKNVVHK